MRGESWEHKQGSAACGAQQPVREGLGWWACGMWWQPKVPVWFLWQLAEPLLSFTRTIHPHTLQYPTVEDSDRGILG